MDRAEKQIYDNATITFVRSSNIQQSLIEQYHYPDERVICVYAGSNVNVDDRRIQQKSYLGKNILYVGIDWNRKGGPEFRDLERHRWTGEVIHVPQVGANGHRHGDAVPFVIGRARGVAVRQAR